MKNHPDYFNAKSGDTNAAYKLVNDIIQGEKQQIKILKLAADYPDAILVGVHAQEAYGINKIPETMAQLIHKATGLKIDANIVQSVKVMRTNSNSFYRLANRPKFSGEIQSGSQYILIDDVITCGGTLSELRCFIESNGGIVVQMLTLSASKFSTNINLSEKTKFKLLGKYDIMNLRSILKEFDIYGGNERYITESEARILTSARTINAARDRIAQARQIRYT